MASSSLAENGGYRFFEFRSSKGLVAACAVMAVFTDTFLYGVVLPVFPFSLPARSGVPQEDVQRILNILVGICGAGIMIGAPFCGWISEWSSTRRLPLLLGFIFLLVSTAMLRFGTAVWVLVCGRFFTGLAGSLTWTVGQSLMVDRVAESESGRYMSLMGLGGHIGMFAGPVLGGAVYDKAGYSAVFDMALGLLLFDIILRSLIIEPKTLEAVKKAKSSNGSSPNSADPERTPLLQDESEPINPIAQSSASSINSQTNSSFRIVEILLSSPRFLTACSSMFLNASLFNALEATLPLFASEEFRYGPSQSAVMFACIIIPSFTGPFWGWIRDRTNSPQTIITIGFCLHVPILIGMAFVQKQISPSALVAGAIEVFKKGNLDADAKRRVGALAGLLVATGVAGSLRGSSIATEFASSVRQLEREGRLRGRGEGVGMAYSICGIMYAAGSVVGPFLGGTVKDILGWRYMCFGLALTAIIAAIPQGLLIKRERAEEADNTS